MKHYAYLLLFISMLLLSCRSNHSLHSNKNTISSAERTAGASSTLHSTSSTQRAVDESNSQNAMSQTKASTQIDEKMEADEYEEKKQRITLYNPDGSVNATIDTEERRGRAEQNARRTGTSDVSLNSSNISAGKKEVENNIIDTTIELESSATSSAEEKSSEVVDEVRHMDSRPVQGLAVILVLVLFLIVRKYGRKK